MFWHFVLPAQITFGIFLCILALGTIIGGKKKWLIGFLLSFVVGVALFIPQCAVVSIVIFPFRFGEFHYQHARDVNHHRVTYFLPDTARNITLNTEVNRFYAQYEITPQELLVFMDQQWQRNGQNSVDPRPIAPQKNASLPYMMTNHFGTPGQTLPNDLETHEGPRARNGAGFTIWYSPSTGVAYQHTAYW